MKKPTAAGMKVLRTYERREDDGFDIECQRLNGILVRSRMRPVNIWRTVEKLIAEGFLRERSAFQGSLFHITEEGRAALSRTAT